MIYFVLAIPLAAWVAMQISSRGGREAFWTAWWVSLLICQFWVSFQVGFFTSDLRFAVMAVAFLGLLVSPGNKGFGFGRFVLADLMELLLVLAHIVSEYKVGRFSPMVVPELLRIWLVPYMAGRLFLRDADDIPKATAAFAPVCRFACIYAIIESIIKFNPVNKILGKTYGLLEAGEGYRMGLKRAQGAQEHPIFMGLVLVLILPWAFEASKMARDGKAPRWWKYLPWLVAAALFGTVSRGPQGSALFTTYLAIFFRNPKKRIAMVFLAIALGFLAVGAKEFILDLSAKISKESEEPVRIIVINGEEEEYTGTRHRVLLFKAYAYYLENAGMWGYGMAMKEVQLEEALAMRFGSIDSAYVMMFLQRGYAGVVPFVGLSIVVLFNLVRVAWPMKKPQARIAGALFGAMFMLVLTLFTSFFSPDFGSAFLFTAGIAARLPSLASGPAPVALEEISTLSTDARPPIPKRFVLVPGHPPVRPFEVAS